VGKNLVLIDGHALAFRMFFALERTNMQTTEHIPTWAVYGFFKAIFDMLLGKSGESIRPDCIAVAFDVSRKTFRSEKFEGYKAHRESMPDSLRPQLGLIMEGLKALNIPIYTKEGFEGDDIIGTIAARAKALGHRTLILTGDKDSFQLIDKEGLVSVIIPSKGEIYKFGREEVFNNMGVYPEQVVDYKALCGDTSDNIPGIKGIGKKTAEELLAQFGTLDKIYENAEAITKNAVREKIKEGKENAYLSQFLATIKTDVDIDFDFSHTHLEIPNKNNVVEFFQRVQFYSFIKNIVNILAPFQACDCGTVLQESAPEEEIVKFSAGADATSAFADEPKEATPLPSARTQPYTAPEVAYKQVQLGFFDGSNSDFLPFAREIDEAQIIKNSGTKMNVTLASYVKDSSRKHDLISQIQNYLGVILTAKTTDEELGAHVLELEKFYETHLSEDEKKLLYDVEMPLAHVLKDIENTGVELDLAYLKELSREIDEKIASFEKKIYEQAGTTFNINSPKQVGEILFDRMQIKPKKKNKTGFSTNAKVLDELAEDYQIARDILEHRTLMKLKTTYIDVLPKLVGADGRVHTHFNQTLTTTGRLSSSEPNLQNIPIRTELGNRIRAAFVPHDRENSVILSVDYSQIELRLLAHCSSDSALIEAFNSKEDIHTITAGKVFGVAPAQVTKEMRRKAKAVNFGLIYGQSRYGLASALGISPFEAQDFIDRYFATYPKIRAYMNNTLMQAHQEGYVETILGRKRYLKEELNSRNAKIREFAERAAINAPLQGSAADLIKMAMVKLHARLIEAGVKAKIILQVHDELVLEVPKSELEEVKKLAVEAMELGQPLKVPLVVDLSVGKTWKDEGLEEAGE